MKNNMMRIALVLCLCAVVFAVWDKDKPASSTSLRNSNPEMLANQSALETALAQDHEFSTGGTNSGNHEVLTMEEESSAGASSTNELHVQAIDGGSGQPEFAITSEDGDELQMTKDGDLFSSDGLTVTEGATFNGGITLGAGDDLIGSATSDITFNTNKFTVAGATGNTLVAGTLTVTGVATLGDTSALATSGAPAADAQIANKKYVDDNIGSANWTPTSYAGEESITLPNGLILKQGIESVAGNTTDEVTYAVAFPSAFTNSWVSFNAQAVALIDAANSKAKGGSETTVLLVTNGHTSTQNISWYVIGY